MAECHDGNLAPPDMRNPLQIRTGPVISKDGQLGKRAANLEEVRTCDVFKHDMTFRDGPRVGALSRPGLTRLIKVASGWRGTV